MEEPLNTTQSAGPSDHAQLHHRDTIPDVPEDVKDDLVLHFNDPNWDFRTNFSTTSISTHGRRHERSTTAYVGTSTEVDKESQVEVTSQPTRESDVDFPSYPEIPSWWFLTLGIVSFVLAVIGNKLCHIGLSIWAAVVSVIFATLAILPIGITEAIANQQIYVNVLEEIVIGYLIPGHPLASAVMMFRLTGFAIVSQAMACSSDPKFGHYVKVPPRLMFSCQVIPSIVVLLSAIGAQEWALDNIPDICSPNQKDFFTCPNLNLYNTLSILWGGIGPRRLFSHVALYYPMLWCFLIGAVLPIPFYVLAHSGAIGPNYASWILVGCVFQWFMRRFHSRWWLRYNYILSSGLDAGLVFGLIVLFFTVQWAKGGIGLSWWGNTVWRNTADARGGTSEDPVSRSNVWAQFMVVILGCCMTLCYRCLYMCMWFLTFILYE
ncbi:OPT oligopeptide transporter protein-domain-containing protein [Russula dissimulans]|nr:OPT oligopeptide transporter protein-domain-containing protein [Russula dissimulans]